MGAKRIGDLDLDELNCGTERVRQRRKKRHPGQELEPKRPPQGKERECLDCGKRAFSTEEDTRLVIARLLATRKLRLENSYVIQPYLCPHGWWHWGRNYRTMTKLKDATKPKPAA